MNRKVLLDSLLQMHPAEKMLFLAGPRQVGKTTLAKNALAIHPGLYFNYDIPLDRRKILREIDLLSDVRGKLKKPFVVFEEIHKMTKFKAFLKGFFDANQNDARIWVTGSGRLDLYQRGGDSLVGRYFLYHLHPLTISELRNKQVLPPKSFWEKIQKFENSQFSYLDLLEFGGFPEPYFKNEKSFYRRWRDSRKHRLIQEDIRDLTRIQYLDRLEQLVDLLPTKVGSPLSLNSLREDLSVSFETIDLWIKTLERVYYIYSLSPYAKNITRALRKEKKMYLWDWSQVTDPAAKFENFVVSHWKRTIDYWNDFGVCTADLLYIRDKEKREVDLVVVVDKKPFLLIEIKLSDPTPSPNLLRFGESIGCKNFLQIINVPNTFKIVQASKTRTLIASPEMVFG